jgi:hypothetical protein
VRISGMAYVPSASRSYNAIPMAFAAAGCRLSYGRKSYCWLALAQELGAGLDAGRPACEPAWETARARESGRDQLQRGTRGHERTGRLSVTPRKLPRMHPGVRKSFVTSVSHPDSEPGATRSRHQPR